MVQRQSQRRQEKLNSNTNVLSLKEMKAKKRKSKISGTRELLDIKSITRDGELIGNGFTSVTAYVSDNVFNKNDVSEEQALEAIHSVVMSLEEGTAIDFTFVNKKSKKSFVASKTSYGKTSNDKLTKLKTETYEYIRKQAELESENTYCSDYITVSYKLGKKSKDTQNLSKTKNRVKSILSTIGKNVKYLNGNERIKIMNSTMNIGTDFSTDITLEELPKTGLQVEDLIVPSSVEFTLPNTAIVNGCYQAGLIFERVSSSAKLEFVKSLTNTDRQQVLNIRIEKLSESELSRGKFASKEMNDYAKSVLSKGQTLCRTIISLRVTDTDEQKLSQYKDELENKFADNGFRVLQTIYEFDSILKDTCCLGAQNYPMMSLYQSEDIAKTIPLVGKEDDSRKGALVGKKSTGDLVFMQVDETKGGLYSYIGSNSSESVSQAIRDLIMYKAVTERNLITLNCGNISEEVSGLISDNTVSIEDERFSYNPIGDEWGVNSVEMAKCIIECVSPTMHISEPSIQRFMAACRIDNSLNILGMAKKMQEEDNIEIGSLGSMIENGPLKNHNSIFNPKVSISNLNLQGKNVTIDANKMFVVYSGLETLMWLNLLSETGMARGSIIYCDKAYQVMSKPNCCRMFIYLITRLRAQGVIVTVDAQQCSPIPNQSKIELASLSSRLTINQTAVQLLSDNSKQLCMDSEDYKLFSGVNDTTSLVIDSGKALLLKSYIPELKYLSHLTI